MWWREISRMNERRATGVARVLGIVALAALLGGCFQPLYGTRSAVGEGSTREALAQVDVAQIPAPNGTPESRIAVELRNQLVFGLTGGGGAPAPTHRLDIRIVPSRVSVIVDITSARPDVENFGLNASFTLVDLKTGKPVLTDNTFARVSYDIPGGEQRFARARGLRDSENRAAQVIADNIRTRLASYFVAKT